MPRPRNKQELLDLSQKNLESLFHFLDSLPAENLQEEFPPGSLNRNVRDVLGHLYHWQLMMLDWYKLGMSGKKPDMPARGYSWKSVPDLNRKINDLYADAQLNQVRLWLNETHFQLRSLIMQHSDEELFTKKHYKWTASTSLGAYLISATSSHYDWALKLIRKQFKKLSSE
ncbi:MAG: ClbS/DfsB family four-helix bundle protein [Bacteroidia bacterium]|nr:ClbS/DfsB family four-helix bundle protein [Bacteroidia bacterium]